MKEAHSQRSSLSSQHLEEKVHNNFEKNIDIKDNNLEKSINNTFDKNNCHIIQHDLINICNIKMFYLRRKSCCQPTSASPQARSGASFIMPDLIGIGVGECVGTS